MIFEYFLFWEQNKSKLLINLIFIFRYVCCQLVVFIDTRIYCTLKRKLQQKKILEMVITRWVMRSTACHIPFGRCLNISCKIRAIGRSGCDGCVFTLPPMGYKGLSNWGVRVKMNLIMQEMWTSATWFFNISWGKIPPDPHRCSCLWHSHLLVRNPTYSSENAIGPEYLRLGSLVNTEFTGSQQLAFIPG